MSGTSPAGPLKTTRKEALEDVYRVIGHESVVQRDLEFATPWFVHEVYQVEQENWSGIYEIVNESQVLKVANILSSHVVYKVKVNEDQSVKLKERIFPHGNREKEKEDIRQDRPTIKFPVIRFMLSLSVLLCLRIASVDISVAYLQLCSITREIFVRPPKENRRKHGTL